MANLTLLALTLTALVAFTTATTIVTTTINDENPISKQRQCSQQLQGQRLNQCHMFLQQPQNIPFEHESPHMGQQQQKQILEQCCQQLQNVEEQCQCEAVKQVFRDVQQQVQQQQGQQQQWPQIAPYLGAQQTQRLKQKAEILPNVCNLQSKMCRIGSISTTVMTESNYDISFDWPFDTRSGSQQCRQTEIQRPVTQCQRYVEQQMQSPMPYLQRPGKQQQQQQQPELQQCCNELQNVRRQCQCEAVKEVAKRVMNQPMQQKQGSQFGGQDQMDIARRVIQNLPNQCYLQVQQCSNIPY